MPVISKITGAPFRFWCQKILPAVYDDSLSYYELLCKVVDYLNKVMEDDINVVNLVNELEEFVNNYFDNLDVQQEINNKLDSMAEDGSLLAVIAPHFDPIIEDYEATLDADLAEYKGEMDADVANFKSTVNTAISAQDTDISNFKNTVNGQLSAQNTEITNFKSSVNTVMSQQDSDISVMQSQMSNFIDSYSDIQTFTDLYTATSTNGLHYINQTIDLSHPYTDYEELDIYWSYNSDKKVIRVKSADLLADGAYISWYVDKSPDTGIPAPMYITMMKLLNGNAAHTQLTLGEAYSEEWNGLAASDATRDKATTASEYTAGEVYKIVGVTYTTSAELTDIRVGANGTTYPTAGDAVRGQYTELSNDLLTNTDFADYSFTENKYINTSGTTADINNPQYASGYRYAVAECIEGDKFYVSGRGSATAGLWTFIQLDGTIIEKSTTTMPENNLELTAPANSAHLIVNSYTSAKCQKGKPVIELIRALQAKQADTDEYIDSIKVIDQKGNVFEAKTDAYNGAYYYRSGSALAKGTNASYNCFIVPVAKSAQYTFVRSNIILLDADKKPLLTGGSWDYEAVTQCFSGDAVYFAVSYLLSNVPSAGYAISKGSSLDYSTYVLSYYVKTLSEDDKPTSKKVSGAITSGNSLAVSGKTAVKDGEQIVFKGKFSAFNALSIIFSSTGVNSVVVDSSNVTITNATNSTITEAHGLTIANDITVLLEFKQGRLYVSITSMGITFKYDCSWYQTGGIPTEPVATANDMAFTEASLAVNYSAAKRRIWYFGDSYAQFGTDTRLPYYMIEYGYDKNVLFNAVSGGTSNSAINSFSTLLNFGRPSIAVMATGMNDGSDTGDTPASLWLTKVQEFISVCESTNIVPVLCTVPTVPSVNNEAKNTWVRSSGYRYVDFAKSVGANANGQWYTGMLSPDNVHPSTTGGNALFTQLIADLPEVMY